MRPTTVKAADTVASERDAAVAAAAGAVGDWNVRGARVRGCGFTLPQRRLFMFFLVVVPNSERMTLVETGQHLVGYLIRVKLFCFLFFVTSERGGTRLVTVE